MQNKYNRIIFVTVLGLMIFSIEYSTFSYIKDLFFVSNYYIYKILVIGLYVFPILFVITTFIGFKHYTKIGSLLYTISAVWFGLIIYLFIGEFIIVIVNNLGIMNGLNVSLYSLEISFFIIACFSILYGVYNASRPRIVKWTIKSKSLSNKWAGKKIILISDTHFGQTRNELFAKKITNILKKENPDIIFHAGDIIDGPSFPYRDSFNHLESLSPSLGIIYVEGNHESYSLEYDTFRSMFPKNITDVTDKKILINDTQIIGLSYKANEKKVGTKKRLNDLGYRKDIPSIVLLHDPKNSIALADLNVSLVLSGHTHGGQFIPINLLIELLYRSFSHGVNYTKDTVGITTHGVGTATIPIRIGTVPEIVIIDIK